MDEEVPIGKQIWIDSADHQQGQTVTAGMLIGHPAFPSTAYANPYAFVSTDVSLVYLGGNLGGEVFDSIFSHMTPAVYAQWSSHGITTDDIIVSKAARDAAPCTSFSGDNPDDYVNLTP